MEIEGEGREGYFGCGRLLRRVRERGKYLGRFPLILREQPRTGSLFLH